MWEHKSGVVGPILHFFHLNLVGVWTQLLKLAKDKIPLKGKDLGFEVGYGAPPVSIHYYICSFLCSKIDLYEPPDSAVLKCLAAM